jgi:putative ABC transport system permease protein
MTLYRVGWRYLLRHPWQTILMITGIMLGVAVAVAVDLANTSASRAFDLSTESIAGKATHQIIGGPQGLDENIYTRLRLSGVIQEAAPMFTAYVSSSQLGGIPFQLFGIDPFVDAPFRNYLGSSLQESRPRQENPGNPPVINLTNFLARPGSIFISENLARRYKLQTGQKIDLEVSGKTHTVTIGGLLNPTDPLSQRALDGLILADIATAQELTGQIGRLDRIDLILPADPKQPCAGEISQPQGCLAAIQTLLPADARIEPVEARGGAVEQMTNAFRVNLTALSLLALVVGMFLIYNTMTFSVIQRRPLFGTLRCLGVTRREVFILVLSEALIIGIIGSIFGLVFGLILGQGAVRLVTQTINDLFFVITVRGVQILPASMIKGFVLGILATLLTAAPPAWEAASISPRAALSRSGLEGKARRAAMKAAIVGLGLIAFGIVILFIFTRSLVASFAATFFIIVGFAMLVPVTTKFLMSNVAPTLGKVWGTLGKMAPRDVINSLSRTSIAVMALMVAVSVTIGVSLMVSSFRNTVQTWLSETLQGDIYISAPSLTATAPSTTIDPDVVETLKTWPGVARVDVLRSVNIDSPHGPIHIDATDNTDVARERVFLASVGSKNTLWQKMLNGSVLVSEPLANRLDLPHQGALIQLYTEKGLEEFPVAGIFYDYSSTQGTVIMALPVYRQNWDDPVISAVALLVDPGVNPDQLVKQLQDNLTGKQSLLIRSNSALRKEVLAVFDRTFAITGALRLLATFVAFIGVLSALLSLELERQRELGILRSIGLTIRQLWRLILLETGLMGAVAGILAMPTGYALSLILVYIINRRSFGWTLQMQIQWEPFISALVLSVSAALLAGIYPAYRMGKMVTSEALRSE